MFLRQKHRLGKATYLVAPSAHNVEPTVQHIRAHEERMEREEVRNGDGSVPHFEDKEEPTIPAAVESDGVIQRRSTSSNALVRNEPPPACRHQADPARH